MGGGGGSRDSKGISITIELLLNCNILISGEIEAGQKTALNRRIWPGSFVAGAVVASKGSVAITIMSSVQVKKKSGECKFCCRNIFRKRSNFCAF